MSSTTFFDTQTYHLTPLIPNLYQGATDTNGNMLITLSVTLNSFQARRQTLSPLPHNLLLGLCRWPIKHKVFLRTTQRIIYRTFGFRIIINKLDRNEIFCRMSQHPTAHPMFRARHHSFLLLKGIRCLSSLSPSLVSLDLPGAVVKRLWAFSLTKRLLHLTTYLGCRLRIYPWRLELQYI